MSGADLCDKTTCSYRVKSIRNWGKLVHTYLYLGTGVKMRGNGFGGEQVQAPVSERILTTSAIPNNASQSPIIWKPWTINFVLSHFLIASEFN